MLSKYNAPTMGRTVGTYHGMRIRKFTNATRALPSVVSTTTAGVAHAGLRMPLAIAPSSLGWTLTRYGRMAVAFDRYRSAPHGPSSRPREAPRSLARLRPSPVRERISSRSHTQAQGGPRIAQASRYHRETCPDRDDAARVDARL